jgi:hypothetical protein
MAEFLDNSDDTESESIVTNLRSYHCNQWPDMYDRLQEQ